jgi:hypothetical protein
MGPHGRLAASLLVMLAAVACTEEPRIGPGDPCGAPPTLIEDVHGDHASLGAVLDTLDVSTCRQGRFSESLALGSAWVELRRVNGSCEVWLGGETEDFSYDGSPHQFCRFSRAGDTHVPIFVGRRQGGDVNGAGPARTCADTVACTVGLPPVGPCPQR